MHSKVPHGLWMQLCSLSTSVCHLNSFPKRLAPAPPPLDVPLLQASVASQWPHAMASAGIWSSEAFVLLLFFLGLFCPVGSCDPSYWILCLKDHSSQCYVGFPQWRGVR